MENISKRTKEIIRLAHDVNRTALDYVHPKSPSALFLWILSMFTGVDDHAYVSDTDFGTEPFLSYFELETLIAWLNRMWKICHNDQDMQLLYDAILKGRY